MENLNNGESSSSSNGDLRSRMELLPKPQLLDLICNLHIKHLPKSQLVDLLCNLASRHPSIAEEIENLTPVYAATLRPKLFVSRLSSTTNTLTLRQAFEKYGEIVDVCVVLDKGCGFVTYKDIKSVRDALIQPEKSVDGSMTICDVADERYKKTNTSSGPDLSLRRKLYIGDLAAGVTTENLRSEFEKHGEIEEAVVMKNATYGFVTYMTAEAAKKAIDYNTLHPTIAQGTKRIVKYATNPRRGPRALPRNPSSEYEQSENAHSSVPYAPLPTHSPYAAYGVYYPPYYYPYQSMY